MKRVFLCVVIYLLAIAAEGRAESVWERVSYPTRVEPTAFAFFGDAIYACGNGLYRLHRGATDWETLLDSTIRLNHISISATGKLLAYSGYNSTDRIYLSDDDGTHWVTMDNPGFGSLMLKPTYTSLPTEIPLLTLSAALTGDGAIYATGGMAGPYVNGPGDTTWRSLGKIKKKCDTCKEWATVAVSDSNIWRCERRDSADKIYVSGSSFSPDSMLRPIDWNLSLPVSLRPDGTWSYCNAIAPDGSLYKLDTNGVLRSTDMGLNWSEYNSGLPTRRVTQIVIDPGGRMLLYTDSGWFLSTISFAGIDQPVPQQTVFAYPNPFTVSGCVHFSLTQPEYVTLSLYNLSGIQVERIANSYMNSGEHDVPFVKGSLPSGIYFYRLVTEAGAWTQTLVIE